MELVHRPATELLALMASREVSAVEVVEAHVAAMHAHAGAINAFVAMASPDTARGAPAGTLSGLPFTVKDTIAVGGAPLIAGDPERHERFAVASEDATAVARVRAAGAIFLGKTNCPLSRPEASPPLRPLSACGLARAPLVGGGIETTNEVFGRTNNPYALTHSVGGSSGGEAAAIAAGCSAFGLGTDSGASVRLPTHFCGLAALKPTAGRVPLHGVIDDLGPVGPLRDPRTQIGILARGVADVALVLSVIEDPRGAPAPAAPAPAPFSTDVRGLRVALLADDGLAPPDADTARVLADAAAALTDAGAVVSDVSPPGGHALTEEIWASYGAGSISYDLLGRWDAFNEAMRHFGERFDAILSPVFPTAAPPHGQVENLTSYTTPHNLSGWPAATVRCGTSADGLPIGMQLAAPPWRDDVALACAGALEAALGGYVPPPAEALAAVPPPRESVEVR